MAQINITIPESVNFLKTPSNCELENRQLLCNIKQGSPLKKGEIEFLNVTLDTINLQGTELLVKANVSSASDEGNDKDNYVIDVIPLSEFSDVEISGFVFIPK